MNRENPYFTSYLGESKLAVGHTPIREGLPHLIWFHVFLITIEISNVIKAIAWTRELGDLALVVLVSALEVFEDASANVNFGEGVIVGGTTVIAQVLRWTRTFPFL